MLAYAAHVAFRLYPIPPNRDYSGMSSLIALCAQVAHLLVKVGTTPAGLPTKATLFGNHLRCMLRVKCSQVQGAQISAFLASSEATLSGIHQDSSNNSNYETQLTEYMRCAPKMFHTALGETVSGTHGSDQQGADYQWLWDDSAWSQTLDQYLNFSLL